MLYGDGADAGLVGQQPLGWELAAIWVYALDNVPAQMLVKLQVNRALVFVNGVFHLAILFSPFLVI